MKSELRKEKVELNRTPALANDLAGLDEETAGRTNTPPLCQILDAIWSAATKAEQGGKTIAER